MVVVPLAGTWIEIRNRYQELKAFCVVPLAGTWIEIQNIRSSVKLIIVVPLAGTWIEIREVVLMANATMSFPSRERGLKSLLYIQF